MQRTWTMSISLDEETRRILIEGARKRFGSPNLSLAIRYAIRQTFGGDRDEEKTA